jgi:predicted glutamine amidotransferase
MALVATEPLTRAEPWQAMVPGELVVLQQGAPVWSSHSLRPVEVLAA